MSIKDRIKKIPFLITLSRVLKLALQEGKLLPNHTQLQHSGHRLYANPLEQRGSALLLNKGTGQPFIKKFWRLAVSTFHPALLIDVGANYGEVFLDCVYPHEQLRRIIVVEANPLLAPYLRQSIERHPQAPKVTFINGLAGDSYREGVPFYVDKLSSGRSTALNQNFVKKEKVLTVNAYRLDEVVKDDLEGTNCLLFKIDVEGYEPYVLSGMDDILTSKADLVGCVEFNLTSLRKNGINVDSYLSKLNEYFSPILLHKDGSLTATDKLSVEVMTNTWNNQYTEGDILLFNKLSHKEAFIAAYHNYNK